MVAMFVDGSGQNERYLKQIPVIEVLCRNRFLAHLAKGNVSFCHHLASVVCRPLTFHILIFSCSLPSFDSFGQAVSEEKIF
jgi:hypothetical protein